MQCSKCATELQADATTCPVCGAAVRAPGARPVLVVAVAVAIMVIAGAVSFLFMLR